MIKTQGNYDDYFINEGFENEENEENKQYTEDNVDIYIDNIKQEFTRKIDPEKFPEKREYHVKLKFKILFKNCKLMSAFCTGIASIDLTNFDASNVENMLSMFLNCSDLISANLSNLNTTNLINMSFIFAECTNLANLNISSMNTKNVEKMYCIFYK